MEELRSTEVLDREIREDARKKADKILRASEDECRLIGEEVVSRVQKAQTQKAAEYSRRIEEYRRDIAAAIPLEKQRRLVAFIDSAVRDSLDLWLSGIGSARRLSLFADQLAKYADILSGKKITAYSAGYPESDVRAAAEGAFGKNRVASVACLSPKQALARGFTDGICAEAEDGSLFCRATIEEIRENLLATRRQELAEALFGGRLPE